MITNLDPASEFFLASVDRIQDRLAEANRQVSSGKRVSQPSDAPDQIDSILQLRADRERNGQIRSNLGLARIEAQGADEALSSAIRLMDRARVLAAQGSSSTVDATGRQSLADEAASLLDQMIAFSQTAVQGRYIFSGDLEQVPAYQADATSPNGVARLVTAPASRRIEGATGGSFEAGKTAQEIFDNRNPADDTFAPDNVFASLAGLRVALLSGDPAAGVAAGDAIKTAAVRLNTMQAFYGGVQSRIKDAAAFAEQYDTELAKQLGEKEDADVTAAALEATQGGTQLQAAFQMRAMLPRRSLFEFIG
jgi:flagellar hook-associated protein 3 FlgL